MLEIVEREPIGASKFLRVGESAGTVVPRGRIMSSFVVTSDVVSSNRDSWTGALHRLGGSISIGTGREEPGDW